MNIWDQMNPSHCDDLRQSGGFMQTVTPAGYEPKVRETSVIESQAISPEDLESTRIELDRNFGTDPYQIHERFVRSMCLTSSRRCIPNTIQRKALQTRTLKMEHYEKCRLHHCICRIEKTMNPLESQLHGGDLLHCFRKEGSKTTI